jgi:Family of unknown function (DUF5317)
MTLFAFALVLGAASGYLLGGRMSSLGSVRIRWWGLIVAGLLLQLVPLPGGDGGTDLVIRTVVLSLSSVMLVAFALINVRVPGMAFIMVGVFANFVVIVANGGMPVGADALRNSGQHAVLAQMRESEADKHHLLTDSDSLTFLSDIIAVPAPIGQAISIGDVIISLGLIWFTASSMRPGTEVRPPGAETRSAISRERETVHTDVPAAR